MDSLKDIKDVFTKRGYKSYVDESFISQKTLAKGMKWNKEHSELLKWVKDHKWLYLELRGKFGNVYPYSETQLAAQAFRDNGKNPTSFVRSKRYNVVQDADDMLVFTFPVSDFNMIAERLQLKKKRILSEKHKNAVKEAQQRRWET